MSKTFDENLIQEPSDGTVDLDEKYGHILALSVLQLLAIHKESVDIRQHLI